CCYRWYPAILSSSHSASLVVMPFILAWSAVLRVLHSFPTRRSSDLPRGGLLLDRYRLRAIHGALRRGQASTRPAPPVVFPGHHRDRKSTRLNSSHVKSSYAVFCLKKKKLAAERRGGAAVGDTLGRPG